MTPPADVIFESRDGVLVARLEGEIDMSNAHSLGAAVREQVPTEAVAVALVMDRVTYLDSAGIAMLFDLNRRLAHRGQQLRLVVAGDAPVAAALRLAGVSSGLASESTLDAALASSD